MKLRAILVFLIFIFLAGCGGRGQQPPPVSNQTPFETGKKRPEAVVEGYLQAVGCSDYRAAAECLEHPKAAVWPGAVLFEQVFNAQVPPDVVRVTNISVGPVFALSPRGDEVNCLARARVAPGKEAQRWGIGQEGEWHFVFRLIDRGSGWQLAWGGPVEERLARYLAGGSQPFVNVTAGPAEKLKPGSSFDLGFDLVLPPELEGAEEVSVNLMPEPETPGYPRHWETSYAAYWYGPGGQKIKVTNFELSERPGPDGIIRGPVTLDADMPPGKYRFYLGLGTRPPLYWPVPPYVVTVE